MGKEFKRDQFAIRAIVELTLLGQAAIVDQKTLVARAYRIADAMMKKRQS
jgi:hypothetical protein